ncbi:MAG: glycosyltransferase [Candidatus Omnitrophica bacterium]|nr:glycosyltransferase [Candidatus Omnitrophota bacterium]
MRHTLSVIIPCYNEARTIRDVIRRVQAVDLGEVDTEIVVVDDGSRDGTRDILRQLSTVTVIFHERNQGKGGAIRTGIAAAAGDLVIIQDADTEYDPGDFQALIRPILDGRTEFVMGSRFLREKRRYLWGGNSPFFTHYVGNQVVIWLTNFLYGNRATDYEGCYKVLTRRLAVALDVRAKGFEFDNELICKALRLGHPIVEVPIRYTPRSYRDGKKITWRHGLQMVWTILLWRVRPLRLPPAAAGAGRAAAIVSAAVPRAGTPLVSICIPVKNMERTIRQTVASALAQTYPHLEVLVVDNRSTDRTREEAAGFQDPRLRVIQNAEDVGVYGNHNRCVEHARGEFVKFLHGDDLLEPACVERMLEPVRAPGGERIGLVACGAIELGPSDAECRRTVIPPGPLRIPGGELYEAVPRLGNFIGTPTMTLLRRQTVRDAGGFDAAIRHSADFDCWLAIAEQADVAFVPHHLVRLRTDPPPADPRRRYNAEQILHYITVLKKRYGRTLGREPLWRSPLGRWICRESVLYTLAYGREALRGHPDAFRRLVSELRRDGLLPQLSWQLMLHGPGTVFRTVTRSSPDPYQRISAYFGSHRERADAVQRARA